MTNNDTGNVLDLPKKSRTTLDGEVLSCDMLKTIVVKVDRTYKHPFFGKVITRSKKYKVHDEKAEAKVGDWVEIVECRPISKTKHMNLNCILRHAE